MDTQDPVISTSPDSTVSISENRNKFESASFIVLLITIILIPIAFLPTAILPLDVVKTAVITFGILISTILYFISLFKSKTISFPKSSLFNISCGILASLAISTLLSPASTKSLFGQGFEIGTASLLFTLFLASLLTFYLTNKDENRFMYVYGAIITSFVVIALFHIVRFFGGSSVILSFGVFEAHTSSLLGKWNDLALFSSVVAILTYLFLRLVNLKPVYKILSIIILLISLSFIFLVNYSVVWAVLFIVMSMVLVYEYNNSQVVANGALGFIKKIPVITAVFLVFIAVLFWKGNNIAGPVIKYLNVTQTEVLLPWQLTLDVASDTIKESPLFGAGPNRFGSQYLQFKPLVVNPTAFWNAEFNNGFALIPTFIVTQGFVGIILWILLIIFFVTVGVKALKVKTDDISRLNIASTFFSSLLLWIICLIYLPSHSVFFLTFILSGLFVAALVNAGRVDLVSVFKKDSKVFKLGSVLLVVIIAVLVVWLAVYAKKTIAIAYFQSGITALRTTGVNGLDVAENNFKVALSYEKKDVYYQALSEINISRITDLAKQIQMQGQQAGKTADPESVKKIGSLIEQAVGYSKVAIALDSTNHYNYLQHARISEIAMSFQIPNAYDETRNSYINALTYTPYDPSIYLNLARVETSQNKLAEAKQYIGTALQLKQNYIEAIFLLSQIQVNQGQIKEAITSVQVATQINPQNPLIFFQLGLLLYNDKNYQSAIDAFNQAIRIDDQYANAQYFLGLSYARVNKMADAIVQFEKLTVSNPDNQEVKLILANLRSDRSPFADAKPPIDSKPEKRQSLPIKDKAQPKQVAN